MSTPKQITVTMKQSLAVRDVLKKHKDPNDMEGLIKKIVAEAKVTEIVAKTFAKGWLYKFEDDNKTSSKDKIKTKQSKTNVEAPTYLVETPMPIKRTPATGTGTVAQIWKLAEEGKTHAEILALGYNKNTVYRQVGEWRKAKAAEKAAKG